MKGVDIRSSGSGNIGATNLGRVLGGIKWFLYAFFLDFAKGAAAPLLFLFVVKQLVTPDTNLVAFFIDKPEYCMVIYSFCAILGHIFPIYLKFKGGKGVATGAGHLHVAIFGMNTGFHNCLICGWFDLDGGPCCRFGSS